MYMRQSDWSPGQYLKFEDERTRPAYDLLSAVPDQGVKYAVDLGCGPGNSTELIIERYPQAEVVGVDSSADMVAKAKERLPGRKFTVADIDKWEPTKAADLLYANAVMQWLPEHDRLFPRLLGYLNPGGCLAIQMPDNLEEATHVAMRDVAADTRWAIRMSEADATRSKIGTASSYYRLLRPYCRRIDIWRTTYHHPLQGLDGIIEWFTGSALRPYLALLNKEEQVDFLEKYRQILARSYEPDDGGMVLLPFPRLFIVATH